MSNFASTQIVVPMSDRLTFPNLENERAKALSHLNNGTADQVKLFNAIFELPLFKYRNLISAVGEIYNNAKVDSGKEFQNLFSTIDTLPRPMKDLPEEVCDLVTSSSDA